MNSKNRINLSRRSFVCGVSATLAMLGLSSVLPGCSNKKEPTVKLPSSIVANIPYFDDYINPVGNLSVFGRSCLWHISEGLYNMDYTTNKTYCGLAALSPTKINDLTYEVFLKHDACFSNGKIVTSNDVVNSFKCSMEDNVYKSILSFIKSVEAKDSNIVIFNLNVPFEEKLQDFLSTVFIFPADKPLYELQSCPIGSGPWMVDSYTTENNKSISFVPNPYYQGKFSLDNNSMIWNYIPNNQERINNLLDGNSYVSANVFCKDEKQINSAGAVIESYQGYKTTFLAFNCEKAPFNSINFRKAIFHALNTKRICDKNLYGHAIPASSIFPTTHSKYRKASSVYEHNVDKAKQYLSSLGINSVNIKLLIDETLIDLFGERVETDLREVGINAELVPVSFKLTDLEKNRELRDFDILIGACDPSIVLNEPDYLLNYWYGDNFWMNNLSGWKLAEPTKWTELNSIINNGIQSKDPETKSSQWNKAVDIIFDQCPILPLYHNEITTLYFPEQLINFKPICASGLFLLGSNINK